MRNIPPEIHPFGHLTLPPVRTRELSNGIKLHVDSGCDVDVCRITVAIPGGEAESPVAGLARIAAQLLVEGTETRSGEEIANTLEFNGAWLTAKATTHHTSLTLSSLNEKLPTVLPLMYDLITRPSFPKEAVESHLRRGAAKIEVDNLKVSVLADHTIRPMVYGTSSPLARVETADEVLAITREDMMTFHYSRLDPAGMHIFLCGRVEPWIEELVHTTFEEIPAGLPYSLASLDLPDSYPPGERRMSVELPGAKQSAVKMVIPTVGRISPDYVAVRDTVTALGGYFGSRLMLNIREDQGLTYGISAMLIGYPEHGYICVESQTDASSVERLIASVKYEMDLMKDPASYTDEEVTRLSRFLISNIATVLDNSMTRMDFFTTHLFADTPPDYFEQQQSVARSLSPALLATTASHCLDLSRLAIVTAGS